MPSLYLVAIKGSKAKTPFYRLWTGEKTNIGPTTAAHAFMRQKDAQGYIDKLNMQEYWEVVSVKFEPKK